jgi:hypothetical protein
VISSTIIFLCCQARPPEGHAYTDQRGFNSYLSDRRAYLPNYKARRTQRQYIGSAHAEKANDLLIARRQKHQGMH